MADDRSKILVGELHDIAEAFRGMLEWKWDGRFGAILAEFPLESKAAVLEILDRYLVCRWDSGTIGEAPEAVKKVKGHLGGLMSGQLLLLSDLDVEPLLYCAWWPWANGQTISIRVGLYRETSDGEGARPPEEMLKATFGLS
jgi:hypothetical protein